MRKTLIVVDMQNDFINGALGTKEAEAIVPFVKDKIKEYREAGNPVFFTRDTHGEDYLDTQEGKNLPVKHCIEGAFGWQISDEIGFSEDVYCVWQNTLEEENRIKIHLDMIGRRRFWHNRNCFLVMKSN